MPGLSSSRPVKGAYGIGTINIKFGPRKKTSLKGFYLFVFGVSLLVFRFLWSRPTLRVTMLTPILRDAYVRLDYMRWMIGSKLWGGDRDLFNQRFSVSETTLTNVPGLKGEWAHIRRDVSNGVVTLSAKSAVDAVFAQGYVHAVERLYQLDISRRKAKGTVAEVLGEDYVSHDKISRTLNIPTLANQDWERLCDAAETKDKDAKSVEQSRKQVALLRAYAAGINAYLSEDPVMPIEFYVYYGAMRDLFYNWGRTPRMEPWTPVDTLAVMRMHAFESSQGWEREYLKAVLVEEVGHDAADSLLSSSSPSSSSAAAASGRVTWLPASTGTAWAFSPRGAGSKRAPLMGTDIQGPVDSYTRWYQNELSWASFGSDSQATVVSGASLPGVPLVMQGRNEHLSWGWAVADEDSEDLFVVDIVRADSDGDSDNGGKESAECEVVLANGQKEAVAVREEEIRYYDLQGPQSTKIEVLTTRHGPIINDIVHATFIGASKKHEALRPASSSSSLSSSGSFRFANLSLSSQALLQPLDLSFPLLMATARGWADFQVACDALQAMALHVVYADRRGNTGYATTGTPVARHRDCDGSVPCRGDGLQDWKKDKGGTRKKPRKLLTDAKASVLASSWDLLGADSALIAALLGESSGGGSEASQEDTLESMLTTFDDVFSPSSLRLAAVINAFELPRPATLEEDLPEQTRDPFVTARLQRQYAEDTTRIEAVKEALRVRQEGTDAPFDGLYTPTATAPAILEVFRNLAADRVLASVGFLQGYLRGAPVTRGLQRDSRSTALLGGSDWLLRILEGHEERWLALQGVDRHSVVEESILGVADWMSRISMGDNEDKGGATSIAPPPPPPPQSAVIDADSVYRWGRHHEAAHTHYAKRHTIQNAVMSPPPMPMPGGAEDSVFRASYAVRSTPFHIYAHGNQLYTKGGMKGELVLPFQCGSEQYLSSFRLVSDLGQPLTLQLLGHNHERAGPSLAWSRGSSLAHHGQIQPPSHFQGGGVSGSLAAEVLAQAVTWLRGGLRPDGAAAGEDGEAGGPAPWQRKWALREGLRQSVVRLVKASKDTRYHDEL